MRAIGDVSKSPIVALTLGAACLVLLWQVATRSLATGVSGFSPSLALLLAPANTEALLNTAETKLGLLVNGRYVSGDEAAPHSVEGKAAFLAIRKRGVVAPMLAPEVTAEVRAEVRLLARQALAQDPLSARAWRILGQAADNDAQAKLFMERAVARSRQETGAVYWLFQNSFLNEDYPATVAYADILLRSQPQLYPVIAPTLGHVAETPTGAEPLVVALTSDPPWRRLFFSNVYDGITDARVPMNLFLAMQQKGGSPTEEELQFYLSFLVSRKFYDMAYYTWSQFLTPEALEVAGLLFNGNFRLPPSGTVFDWKITNAEGARIDIVDVAENAGQKALQLDFIGGVVGAIKVSQVVTLTPGAYRLHGLSRGNLRVRRGLRWKVFCMEDITATSLADTEPFSGSVPVWKDFAMDFNIPQQNCRAQSVSLYLDARSPSESLVSGSQEFTDLSISARKK